VSIHWGANWVHQVPFELVPFERKKFKLNYANDEDCQWLLKELHKQFMQFNTHSKLEKNVIYLTLT